jgi:asparagine synthase (glutamine-hydrolysing)
MSGIFGIIRLPGAPVAEAELAPMAETLKHRGPDGINYFARENAGLGHCMLQSTPESLHETLPLRDEAAGLTITADARIDNREQLMRDIPVHASSDQVITDSQLILHAYMKWGEHCVDHLLGDFVFAIWDERAQTLFVARDHMGCKPFYYHCHDGLFVFASSAMAVARVPEVKATLNEGRVADYLVQELEGINKTCSWYNEISRMPPAQCGYFRKNTFQYRQYWTLEPADLSHLKTDEDYLEAFTEVYTEAVRCRLRCNTEPASMLSGGLDSSTIVALARDILVGEGKPPLRTYSGIAEQGVDCPETQSVSAVVKQGNLLSTCVRPSDCESHTDALAAVSEMIEDPFDGDSTLFFLLFLEAAKDNGRMVLSGLEGEAAVGAPTNYLVYLMRQGRWRKAWYEAKGFSQHYYRDYYSARLLYFHALRSCLVPDLFRVFWRKIQFPNRYKRLLAERAIAPEFAIETGLSDRVMEYDESMLVQSGVSLQNWHQHIMQVPYLTIAVERYERLASYFGVETRHPLLDVRLLEFSAALPLEQKVRDGWSKLMLRKVAAERLPQSVAWREGWEQLGWKFTVWRIQQIRASSGVPLEHMKGLMGSYADTTKLELYQNLGISGPDTDKVLDSWNHFNLYLWLSLHFWALDKVSPFYDSNKYNHTDP